MTYLIVGIGGALGSLVRFILGAKITAKSKRAFPTGTFIINVTGALLLGLVNHIAMDKSLLLLLADGFLGAYTTFSTFMYEGFTLFHGRKHLNAVVYIAGTVSLGIVFYIAGMFIARLF